MKSIPAACLVCLLAVLSNAGAFPLVAQADAAPARDTAEVLAATESFLSAFSNLEWESFHSSFSPSATVFLPSGDPWRNEDREEAAAFFRSFFDRVRAAAEGPPYGNIVPQDLRIHMLDNAAVVTFHLPGAGVVGRRTLVFARDAPGEPWRIMHLHASVQRLPEDSAVEDTGAVVHVAPPTGEREADRASILAALDSVRPGGTVQFAPGTYLLGEYIHVSTADLTLLGHPEGTTLRGCDPTTFSDVEVAVAGCNGLALTGERQTVRDLTFEHTWHSLWVGCCLDPEEAGERVESARGGGHLIEGNTFRASINGFRVVGDLPEPVVIRDNDFINVWHAGVVNGRTAHIIGNRVSVPDPEEVPVNGFPGLALAVSPQHPLLVEKMFTCAGNVIAENRIEGHPEAIAIFVFSAGGKCRNNVIRDNDIAVSRVRFTGPLWGVLGITDEADSTLAGVPITLADLSTEMAEFFGLPQATDDEDRIHDNLIQGNRIAGAEGLGIEIFRASRNRIVHNTITGITTRDPFPGNTMYVPPGWLEGNGSGIWISPGSNENEVAGNIFEDVASYGVVIEGDGNRVSGPGAANAVRDLGTGNRVSRERR